jgi:hypothetical protein
MSEPVSLSMLEFLSWISRRPRTYGEAMEAWRSSCPRHTVWEDAVVGGLIRVESGGPLREAGVVLTARGQGLLERHARPERTVTDPPPDA